MFEVLCFGDSNTWGYSPKSRDRFARKTRWPGVLQAALGDGFSVVEEGLGGRTTVWDDPIEGDKNGRRQLPAPLESHKPLDLVVLMLGTNDLKRRFSAPASDIAAGVERLIGIILASSSGGTGKAPRILVIAPPPLGRLSDLAEMFEGGTEKSPAAGQAVQAGRRGIRVRVSRRGQRDSLERPGRNPLRGEGAPGPRRGGREGSQEDPRRVRVLDA